MQSKVALGSHNFYFFSSMKALVKRHQRHWLCGFPVGSREAKQLCTTLTQVADRVHLPLGSQLAALSGAGGAWIVTNCRSEFAWTSVRQRRCCRRLAANISSNLPCPAWRICHNSWGCRTELCYIKAALNRRRVGDGYSVTETA